MTDGDQPEYDEAIMTEPCPWCGGYGLHECDDDEYDRELKHLYRFKLSDYAQKVEIYESAEGQTANMVIEEAKALDLIDAMLTEIERGHK